jgi:hypothetical protein
MLSFDTPHPPLLAPNQRPTPIERKLAPAGGPDALELAGGPAALALQRRAVTEGWSAAVTPTERKLELAGGSDALELAGGPDALELASGPAARPSTQRPTNILCHFTSTTMFTTHLFTVTSTTQQKPKKATRPKGVARRPVARSHRTQNTTSRIWKIP